MRTNFSVWREIPLSRGQKALIDEADYPLIAGRRWVAMKAYAPGKFYAVSNKMVNGKNTATMLHRLLMDPPEGMVVDHVNGDPLDNRRENMRVCTVGQNSLNRTKQKNCRSGAKGVYWDRNRGCWKVLVKVEKKSHHGGSFYSLVMAKECAARLILRLHGEFARI